MVRTAISPAARLAALAAVITVCLGLVHAAPASAAGSHAQATHGTVRLACRTTSVRRWPGGPVAGVLRKGRDFRRYSFRGAWALGFVTHHSQVRGYVLSSAFCPPSAAGRAALRRARALAAKSGPLRGRPGVVLPRVRRARVCAQTVWVRDRPINRATGILWAGDEFVVRRHARSPWAGGTALGHEQHAAWVPRSALCRGLDHGPPGYRFVHPPGERGSVLAPPPTVACAARVAGRRMVQAGAHGDTAAELRTGGRRVGVVARFGSGRSRYAALGPLRCGRAYTLAYRAGAVTHRFTFVVGPTAGAHRAVAVAAALTPCSSRPGRAFAHGGHGPVDHRYHVRPSLTRNGGEIAFDTPKALVVADTDHVRDVYLWMPGHAPVLESAGPGTSRAPAIAQDGSALAFETDDAGASRQVVVRRLTGGSIELVSATATGRPGNGASRTAAISGDGRLVAFESRAADLVAGAPSQGLYLRDLATRKTRLLAAGGYRPALSADGRFVAYETLRAGRWQIVRQDVATGRSVIVSVDRTGRPARGTSLAAAISADGTVVAFQSDAPRLVARDFNGLRDVFARDLGTGRTVLVSRNRCGRAGNGYSRYPALSADGTLVAFDSHATDLAATVAAGRGHVYVARPGGRPPRLLDRTPAGVVSHRTAFSPALSGDGAWVAFPSFARDLAPDQDGEVDVFTRRVAHGPVRRASSTRA